MKITKKMRNDIILIAVILVVSLVGILILRLTEKQGSYAVVKLRGEVVAEYPLDKNAVYELKGVTSKEGEPITNVLVIENGEAYLSDANCPDKTCVKKGKIKYVGQSITCLPNELVVKVVGDTDGGVDLVS